MAVVPGRAALRFQGFDSRGKFRSGPKLMSSLPPPPSILGELNLGGGGVVGMVGEPLLFLGEPLLNHRFLIHRLIRHDRANVSAKGWSSDRAQPQESRYKGPRGQSLKRFQKKIHPYNPLHPNNQTQGLRSSPATVGAFMPLAIICHSTGMGCKIC